MKKPISTLHYRCCFMLGLSLPVAAGAYDPPTHALITWHATNRSVLSANSPLYTQLGINNIIEGSDTPYGGHRIYQRTDKPFGKRYFDQLAKSVLNRNVDEKFENEKMAGSDEYYLVNGWLMRGAIREDDNPNETKDVKDYDASIFHREFNHFFDPLHNTPLLGNAGQGILAAATSAIYFGKGTNEAGIPTGADTGQLLTAPSWAMGVDDIYADPNKPGSVDMNHFTVMNAREAMWRALTGKSKTGTPITAGGTPPTAADRKAYWATMFRALGDVLHLNEDMAQPQHTRDEPHSGVGPRLVQDVATGHESEYEAYVEAIVHGKNFYVIDSKKTPVKGTIPTIEAFDSYPVQAFPDYASYWSTGKSAGKGLADYSNANFFTQAHNFGNPDYASPVSNASAYTTQTVLDPDSDPRQPSYITYLAGSIPDTVAGNSAVVKRSRESAWAKAVSQRAIAPKGYDNVLDQAVYYDDATLLVPRAVGYATGLINYFFRGSLDISPPAIGVYGIVDDQVENTKDTAGFRKIRLQVKNTTPSNTGWGPQDMSGGSLTAVVKFHRNTCYLSDLTHEWDDTAGTGVMSDNCRSNDEEVVSSNTGVNGSPITGVTLLAGRDPQEFAFDFSSTPIPVNATDVYLQVVYRGKQGTEADTVVVGTANISEPTHVMLRNVTSDFVCINGAWLPLNGDGSLPDTLKQAILKVGGDPSKAHAVPYSVAAFSFQQSATAPYVTSSGKFSTPFQYPLVELASGTTLTANQYIEFSVLSPPATYFAKYIQGFEYFDTEPFVGAMDEVLYSDKLVTINTTPMYNLLNLKSTSPTFAYLYFGTTDCDDTKDDPSSDTGADGKVFSPAAKRVAAKIDF